MIIDDESEAIIVWKRRKAPRDLLAARYYEWEYENETHNEGHELCGIKTHEVPVCQIKRYKMIKLRSTYEEYETLKKKNKYDDLQCTSDETCRETYQEIFRNDGRRLDVVTRQPSKS
ncbi:hypothetical protein Tco_0065533 [Tanacetum coccineum]